MACLIPTGTLDDTCDSFAHQEGDNPCSVVIFGWGPRPEVILQDIPGPQLLPVGRQNIDTILALYKLCPAKFPWLPSITAMRPAAALTLGARSWQSASVLAIGGCIAHFVDALAPKVAKYACVHLFVLLVALDFSLSKIEWKPDGRPSGFLAGSWRPKSAIFAGIWLACRCIGTVATIGAYIETVALVVVPFTAPHLGARQWLLLAIGLLPAQLRLFFGLFLVHGPHATSRTWYAGTSGIIALTLVAMATPPAAFVLYLVCHIDYALYGVPPLL